MDSILKKHDLSALLFCNTSEYENRNMLYFSGYSSIGCLLITKKRSLLFVPEMEYSRAKAASKVKVVMWKKGKRLFESLRDFLRSEKLPLKKIGLDYQDISTIAFTSLKKYLKVKTVDISKDCLEVRSVKSRKELDILKKSCTIASDIMKRCIKDMKHFRTEQDVANFLHMETIRQGCTLAFPSIVASGKSAGMPHYEPKDIPLRKGLCVIDFGVNYKGYHSDITRTVPIGKLNKKQKELYRMLLASHKKLINSVKVGMPCKKVYDMCNMFLGKFAKNFTHSLGHGIGLQIHELPNLSPASTDTFKNGMVFTIEPGIYFPDMGMRIEDDILIEDGKVKLLSKVPY